MLSSESAIAYRCPSCTEEVFGAIDAFRKSAGKINLKCSCGKSALTADIDDDNHVTLTVPCIFCPAPHVYSLSKDALFSSGMFALTCPATGLPSCFIGPAQAVSDAADKNEKDIRRIADEAGIDLDDGNNLAIDQNAIKEQLLRILGLLKAENRIICMCDDEKSGDLALTVTADGVEVSCKKCGAKRFFRAMSTLDCEYLSEIDLLYLE